ncbi:NFX1-type zinc finger-containing protein 1 isoform X2 [Nasonia vitripennis]|uniref:RZ-type domain-containing protein n=1 Tax=Nasonia vitripennis TaxID=7425 RepID=A0A7M7LLG4_NASVI|nr:NFX1-type zinc finger-containing protein 1 isoform X2 [Nasonia vitripennis]
MRNNRNENLRDPGRNVNLANNYASLQYPNLTDQRLRLPELIGHQNLINYHQLGQQGGINQNNEGQRQRHVGINQNDQGVQRRDGNVNQNNQEQYGRGRHNNPNNQRQQRRDGINNQPYQGQQRRAGINNQPYQRQQRREGNENNNGQHQRREENQNNNGQYQRRESNGSQQNQGQRRQSSYNRSERNNQSSRKYFTFTYLDDLSKKNSDDVTAAIVNHKDEFEKFLNDDIRPDMFVLTLRVLTNICQANFTEMVTSVLSNACSPKFLSSLQNFLNKLPFETVMEKQNNRLYHNDKNKFWSNLAQFFKKLIELMPTKARDELTIVLEKLPKMLPNIEAEQNFKVEESIRNSLMNMSEDLKEEIKRIKIKNKVSEVRPDEQLVEGDPPEDFRLLSVIPTIQDLQNTAPFYRKCRVENAYDSVEHYLDVQFRLLREDFISPLRSGIQEYLHGSQKNRNSDVRVYKKVNLKAPDVKEKNVGIELNFGTIKGINWKRTKRFMYGGLLLLSSDNFRTVLFVTIIDRNDNQLEKGCFLVEPCRGTNITREMYDIDFVMLESKIYFEPYLAVLTALQQMNEDNFPMEPYLVKGDRNSRPPRYLTSNYSTTLKYKNMLLPIAQGQPWPPAQQLGLDESQYQAFRCALTQDFAVIQGPPGTGKTFIALEIVSTLLSNHEHWKRFGPIVVVCLTNHALDQFLEGILIFTDSIVRVGSRSKSEKMKKYTLMERRKIVSTPKHSDARAVMYETKHELETVLSSMKKARLNVQLLETPYAIVPLACLVNYLGEEVLRFSSNEEFVKWLLGEEIVQNLRFKKPVEPAKTVQEQLDDGPGYYDDDENHMDNDLELNYDFKVDDNFDPIFPIESINAKFEKTREDIEEYTRMAAENKDLQFDPTPEWREMCMTLTNQRLRLQQYLAQHPLLGARRDRGRNITNDSNWRTYWQWVLISHQSAMDELAKLEREYHHLNLRLNEVKQYVDLDVLKEHLIVGLTTNGAAKLHLSLRALRAPIVLVEEAAEILEGHVVCSMTKHCQHAILIGDHKQLRPKSSVYKLGKDFNLNISLFERMVKTRGDCTQLAHQHRMRPEFAKLITPSIYDTLYNHESVFNRDNIKGVVKNLFFLHHENHESSHNNEESYANQHECVFLVAFATYLIKQGYNPSEITILCTYTGQLFALMKETGRYTILKQMRVTTVDNYQGEENKIILLSLVRNNGEGNTGFLKEENRVCVALSRARDGMYIMGNMNDLVVKNTIWPKIKKVLEEENAIGNALELRCQIHPQQITQIKDLQDFQKCPEGGCSKKCDLPLSCGHICTSVCHILDREHKEYSCKQPCTIKCPNNHLCPLRCYQGCKPCKVKVRRKLRCGHTMEMLCSTDPETFACTFVIDAILPDCNHAIKKPCYLPIKDAVCTHPCEENRLPCGHVCELKCHVTKDPEHLQYKCYRECPRMYGNCEKNHRCKKLCHEPCGPCPILVEKTRSCRHFYKQFVCSNNVEDIKCERPCTRPRTCGHKCLYKCCEPCLNCQYKVIKRSSCGHDVEVKCCEEASPSKCSKKCTKLLNCGHPCSNRCKDACTTDCQAKVKLRNPGLCGHVLEVPCYLQSTDPKSQELLKYCTASCTEELECKHLCKGTCGACKQGRLHISCAEPCNNILICGHQCEVPCRLECQPCKKKCELKCRHSKCSQKCGMPCTPCKEKCDWGCEHRRCSKQCSEPCNIEPCNEPCKKLLKCGHPCVGFCGDPCPPLCRICNKDDLTELFFGDEDEEDARFVYLEDCNHCIESEGLTKWVTKFSEFVQMKVCPKCKTPIRKCMRLMNQIKSDLRDVMSIKEKNFSHNQKNLETKQLEHIATLRMMSADRFLPEFPSLKEYLSDLWNRGIPVQNQKKQVLNGQEIETFRIVLDIISRIFKILSHVKNRNASVYQYVKQQVNMLVESLPKNWQITRQSIKDTESELLRLNYLVELCKEDYIYSTLINKREFRTTLSKLLSIHRFTNKLEDEVKKEIKSLMHLFSTELKIEREMIVKAMGFKQGHWFKCPNGHFYTIGECGGAMQQSKCFECGAAIGGSQHRLLSDNRLASEIDGATRSAWPGNYP